MRWIGVSWVEEKDITDPYSTSRQAPLKDFSVVPSSLGQELKWLPWKKITKEGVMKE